MIKCHSFDQKGNMDFYSDVINQNGSATAASIGCVLTNTQPILK